MLVEFSVENLLSFKDRSSFSMVAGKERLKKNHVNKAINKISTLKLATLFGANASGKSNLIKAIDLGKRLVTKEVDLTSKMANKFRLVENVNPTSTLQYKIHHKGYIYIYGFSFDSLQFTEEWLYLLKSKDGEAEQVFDRKFKDTKPQIELGKMFENEDIMTKNLFESYKEDSLLISLIDQFNFKNESIGLKHMQNIYDWFSNSLTIIYPTSKATTGIQHELNRNSDFREVFTKFLNALDTGIDKIVFKEIKKENLPFPDKFLDKVISSLSKKGSEKNTASISDQVKGELVLINKEDDEIKFFKLVTQRKVEGCDRYIDFDTSEEESDGTKRLFDLIPIIMSTVKGDNVVIIDEIERSLHPNLVQALIKFYIRFASDTYSQLILATHESALLDQEILRRDEIWFISKAKNGSSSLNSLSEYNQRFDKELRKSYLNGRFNGIPNLSEIGSNIK
ncbi:TPA: ATP-binding protein [Acinetobacter nosocomialis]|nr:ATP-binding protein [Acinetobacter nosocomialis]